MTKYLSKLLNMVWDSSRGEIIFSNDSFEPVTEGFLHTQDIEASVWNVKHRKFNTVYTYQVFQIVDDEIKVITPSKVVTTSDTEIQIEFDEPVAGHASFFFTSNVITPLAISATPTPTPTISVTPSVTMAVTPTPTPTPTITVTPTVTPTPSSV